MAKFYCTGLHSYRSDNIITFNWLLPPGKNYKKGTLQYKILTDGKSENSFKWKTVQLSGSTSMPVSYSITVSPNLYYPTTKVILNAIVWRVKMQNGAYASNIFNFSKPNPPTLKISGDGFEWSTLENISSNSVFFQDVEYQTLLSGSADSPNWSSSSVSSGTGTSSGSQSYTDQSGYRWFRCRVRGVSGPSDWVMLYKSHTVPLKATDVAANLEGGNLVVRFRCQTDINYAQIYYAVDTPGPGYQCPPGTSWNELAQYVPSADSGVRICSRAITPPALDQAVWVRVDTYNSPNATTGDIVYVASGGLALPTITGCVINASDKTVTFTYTNNSAVAGTEIACVDSDENVLGTSSNMSGSITCSYSLSPSVDDIQFGLYAFYRSGYVNVRSNTVWQSVDTSVPLAPENLTASKTPTSGKVLLKWENRWTYANTTEISWADDPDAWASTDKPKDFALEGTAESIYVTGLSTGKTWYFRVRSVHLAVSDTDSDCYGPWCSQTVALSLSEVPDAPVVSLSDTVVAPGIPLTVGWVYISNDGTDQASATIYIDDVPVYDITGTAQSYTITPDWENGEAHIIKVATVSESGMPSAKSAGVTINVAPALTMTYTTSLDSGVNYYPIQDSNGLDILDSNGLPLLDTPSNDIKLRNMPLIISVSGAGEGGTTMISIIRDGPFVAARPDDTRYDGYDRETIYTHAFLGDVSSTEIRPEDLVGKFDDTCYYWLILTINDSLGQTAEERIRFKVNWTHKADIPSCSVSIDTEKEIALITPEAPAGAAIGDRCRIYRLSKDRPELIVDAADYGVTYVDPYPASEGGYRVVDVTSDGEFLSTLYPAWADEPHGYAIPDTIIDFDELNQVILPFNITLQSTWAKDFQKTRYLNGSIVGDWNSGVERTGSVGTVIPRDDETMDIMRRLADYAGICHIRTPEGSSYTADIQVAESTAYNSQSVAYDITISKVDGQGLDGMSYADWIAEQGE